MLRTRFPNIPVMALTATATTRVRADIVKQLSLRNCKWFLSSFNRPNLQYFVRPKTGSKTTTELQELIKTKFPKASGIVYCLSRKECDQMAQNLRSVRFLYLIKRRRRILLIQQIHITLSISGWHQSSQLPCWPV